MSFVRHLECASCGARIPADEHRYSCPDCGGFLNVVFDTDRMRQALKKEEFDRRPHGIMQRWLEFLPIESPDLISRVSLGEAVTPFIRARRLGEYLGLPELYIKDESRFPTGSLKDRSMPLVVLKALEFGFDSVAIVSSGNAAASLSAYAARSGLNAVVFVAGGKSMRLVKCRSYGSALVHVDAPYSDVERLFLKAREAYGWYDCNGLINPFRLEGKKTLAHEICQGLGWSAPDLVLMPVAFGNGLVSAWRGFAELEAIGWTGSMPALYGAQPDVCAPIARAFERGDQEVSPVSPGTTLAASIAVGDPSIGGKRVLDAARRSGGGVLGVPEDLIAESQELLATREGLFVEPSAAVGLAAVVMLKENGRLARDARIVVEITGEGLNAPEAVEEWAAPQEDVPSDLASLREALRRVAGRLTTSR